MTGFHWQSIWVAAQFLATVVGIAAVTSLLVALGYGVLRKADATPTERSYWVIVARAMPFVFLLAIVGGLCGQRGGGSREGVVGQVLPALFTLFGGYIAVYLGEKKDQSGKVAVNTVAFLLSFFVMYNVSAIWRQDNEAWQFCRDLYSNPDIDGEGERQDRELYWKAFCTAVFEQSTVQPTSNRT